MKREEKLNDYEGFVGKFKPKKTTDDCYTPQGVYEIIKNWVDKNVSPLDGVHIVRPFYPGGDYEYYDYPDGCIVLDNPPFSILAKIRAFYNSKGIKYFLFAPHLTLFSAPWEGETYIVADVGIEYENGAVVNTSFITNLTPDCKIRVVGSLKSEIAKYKESIAPPRKKYGHSRNVITAALLGFICKDPQVDWKVSPDACVRVSGIDSMRAVKRSLFGGGFLISERAAAERAAAERAAAVSVEEWPLSEREWEIVRSLK